MVENERWNEWVIPVPQILGIFGLLLYLNKLTILQPIMHYRKYNYLSFLSNSYMICSTKSKVMNNDTILSITDSHRTVSCLNVRQQSHPCNLRTLYSVCVTWPAVLSRLVGSCISWLVVRKNLLWVHLHLCLEWTVHSKV